jgi:hypothetical protein
VAPADVVALVAGRLAVASLPWHNGDVDLFDVRTGHVLRTLLADKRGRLSVAGLSFLRPGHLLVTYTTGPTCTSDLADCGALPHTCGGELDDVDVTEGTITVLWRLGVDTRLASAVPSPDGTEIAALTSPCIPSYFNDHLVVRRLRDGASWTIGASLNRCHSKSAPVWTNDGRDLLVVYAPPSQGPAYTGPDGGCWTTTDAWLVQVDAQHAQPGLIGQRRPPATHCTFEAVTSQGHDIYAVQGCGTDQFRLDGPAGLVQLDSRLHTDRTWSLGSCTDGSAVSANALGQVLVSIYLYCSAGSRSPETDLDLLSHGNLTRSATTEGGELAYQFLTW